MLKRFGLIVVLCCAGFVSAAAQEASPAPDVSRIDQLKALDQSGQAAGMEPIVLPTDVLGEDGTRSMQQAMRAYYDYRTSGYEHRRNVFAWQLLSSKIIFVLVVLLVLAGMYFSWLQFSAALRKDGASGDAVGTTFEASATGLKVSSPVLGIIILAISLAFFYLYLIHIYPIVEIV